MLSEYVKKQVQSPSVVEAVADLGRGRKVIDIRQRVLLSAVANIKDAFKFVVTKYGLPHLATPRPAPLTNEFVMRALVMLRCIYKYEVSSALDNIPVYTVKGGMYEGMNVRAPGREELCGKNGGLIVDTYKALHIDELGYEASCGGTVGVMQAAHLLAEAGLILERYETQIWGSEGVPEKVEAYKKAKTPYALTDVGRIFSFWLFGDSGAVIKSNGINNNGYSGISPVGYSSNGNYSGWLNFLELDYPTSSNGANMDETLASIGAQNVADTTSDNETVDTEDAADLGQEANNGNDNQTDPLADISDSLMKLADMVKVEVDVNDLDHEDE